MLCKNRSIKADRPVNLTTTNYLAHSAATDIPARYYVSV